MWYRKVTSISLFYRAMSDFQGRGHRFRKKRRRGVLVTFVCLDKVKTPLLLLFPTWWKAIEVHSRAALQQDSGSTHSCSVALAHPTHIPWPHDFPDVAGKFPFPMKGRSQEALGSYFHIAADSSYVPTAASPCSVIPGRLRLFPACEHVHEMWHISGGSWLDDKPGR